MLSRLKSKAVFLTVLLVFLLGAIITSVVVYAESYYTVRINYVFKDGSPAHDPYVATFRAGDQVSLTITNPNIDGFVPMTESDGGVSAATSTFSIDSIDANVTETVYYIAGLTPYKVMYYKQNIYDDLYSRDNSVSAAYTERYGYTGANPTELEEEELFNGFTNLFHEPDAIAADGSTVFRVYYDRNYYVINFNLGEGGYGVEPVYAKYQSVYHISEPTRHGYSFLGWAKTDADSSIGEQGDDWNYIDDNGNIITEEQALASARIFSEGEVPAHNVYYKAMWESKTSKYTMVYWIEKPESTLSDDDFVGKTEEEEFDLITANYSVVASYEVEDVVSGTELSYEDTVGRYDLFENASELQSAYNMMSPAVKSDLTNNKRYYELNEEASRLPFDFYTNNRIAVAGDGSTRINVYYNRKEFTLKFFYAKSEGGTLTVDENGSKGLEGGKISLTSGTKNFSVNGQDSATATFKPIITQLRNASFQRPVVDRLPQILKEGLKADFIEDTEKKHRYWFYEIKAKYGASMENIWFNDAFDTQHRNDRTDPRDIVRFGSWAVQEGSRYKVGKSNYTVKGIFERLADDVLLTETFVNYNLQQNTPGFDYTTLYFVASWDNTAAGTGDWNGTWNKVYNFTYKNYTQLLPREQYIIEAAGMDTFLKGGEYPGGTFSGNGFYYEAGYWEAGQYIDVIENNGVLYGLQPRNLIETIDAGGEYHSHHNNPTELTKDVRNNQTAVSMVGYTFIKDPNGTNINKDYTRYYLDGSQVITENKVTRNTNGNPIANWYDADGEDGFDEKHHADVLFFYNYNTYNLWYYNYNETLQAQSPRASYNASFTATPLKYENPVFPVEGLENYYEFEGWYWDPYYTVPLDYNTDHMPADDTTFYAKWSPKKIHVSFYPSYNDYYQQENRIKCMDNPDYDEEDPGDTEKWIDGDIPVEYGSYIPQHNVPIDADDADNHRPALEPPAEGAMFAGWYYLRDNKPVRFEPENVPVAALNEEAAGSNGKLQLFAEWVTKDVAKYKVSYVEKDNPDVEVASSTTGRAFVWKTRTFGAKSGSELNSEHEWVEDGYNWWPTVTSHSIVVASNRQGDEYEPNTYTFEYVSKQGVYYTVQYLDAVTRAELRPTETHYSTLASVKADAKFIQGYVAENLTQKLVLSASTKSTAEEQKADELKTNVITFYYNSNDVEYLYEIEYYKQNVDDDGYTLFQTETKTVPIAEAPNATTISIADLYNGQFPQLFVINGCTLVNGATEVTNTPASGEPVTTIVSDDAVVTVTADNKTTVKMYFNRSKYNYSYEYVDYKAERAYLDASEEERATMWNGVIESHNGASAEKVEKEINIPAPQDLTYSAENIPYTRIDDKDIVLTIAPTENNPEINHIKVYYRKFHERELDYKLACANEDSPYSVVDYDPATGDPLFGGLSSTLQTVEHYGEIQPVTFYNFNDAKTGNGGAESYVHLHRYNFLGWYDNPKGEGTPYTTSETLTKEDLGLDDDIPERDTVYYAVVEQVMVKAEFEFRTVEGDLPADDAEATAVVAAAPIDSDGDKTGGEFVFSSPSGYQNNTPVPWHRTDGYSLSIEPKDDKVYKYEFCEWWEEDLTTHTLIRKKNWNTSGEFVSTELQNQVTRNSDKHIIAVYKRRNVTEMPYSIKYTFNTRNFGTQDYVVKGTLNADELNENDPNVKITAAGCFELTDNFVLMNAPYESNHGETLEWSDTQIVKTSYKGDAEAENESERADRIVTNVTAIQNVRKVVANYRLTSDGGYTAIQTFTGANRETDEKLAAIDLRGNDSFSYWAISKTADGEPIAKCHDALFSFCMFDNYFITPVFNEDETEQTQITLTHLDYSRNRWTDENDEVPANGSTDLLYTDFEIAYANDTDNIFGKDSEYKTGVVFELCTKLPAGKTFEQGRDYGYTTNEANLKQAILDGQNGNVTSYYYKEGKRRSIQISKIATENLTNKNRIQFGQYYTNTYTQNGDTRTYTNKIYVMKATAYLIDGSGNVTLSNPVYTCLNNVGNQDFAVESVNS